MEKIEFNDDSENEVESKDSNDNKKEELKSKEKLPHIKVKNKYSIKDKLKFINLEEETSIHHVAEKYSIDRKSIREWIKQKIYFLVHQIKIDLNYPVGEGNLIYRLEKKVWL